MTIRPARLRRVQLAVPGGNARMAAKAAASRADHVFLDLEDSVAPSAKDVARAAAVEALNTLDWGNKTRCVRINDLSSPHCYADIVAVVEGAGSRLDTIMVPKVTRAADVQFVATLLGQIEARHGLSRPIGIEVLIEEMQGLENVGTIARAHPRLEALILGMGDLSAAQGMDPSVLGASCAYPGDVWHHARGLVVVAARAAGLDPIDGPFPAYGDVDAYAEQCRRAAILGFSGKWAIHPSQIEPALDAFSPTAASVRQARAVADAYASAVRDGSGTATLDGMMIDAASVRMVAGTLRMAGLIGM